MHGESVHVFARLADTPPSTVFQYVRKRWHSESSYDRSPFFRFPSLHPPLCPPSLLPFIPSVRISLTLSFGLNLDLDLNLNLDAGLDLDIVVGLDVDGDPDLDIDVALAIDRHLDTKG